MYILYSSLTRDPTSGVTSPIEQGHGPDPQPDPADGPGRVAHPDRLALPVRGLRQDALAGLEPRRGAARAVLFGGVPALLDRAAGRPLPQPGRRELAAVARPADGVEPAAGGARPDARPLHPARVRGRPRAARALLRLLVPDARRLRARRRGQLPAREQEPRRGGGGRRRPLLQDRSYRRAGPAARARARAAACRPSRRQPDEPHPGAAGARAPQFPARPFRDARARRARRRRRREGPGARRSRAPRLHRPRRPGARAARADRPALRGGRGALRHQPAPAPEGRRVARQDLSPAGEALRRLEGDDPEGAARGRRDRLAALHPHGHRGGLHGGGPARAVREDDGHGRRVLPPHGGRRQAHGPRARDRPPALLQPGLPGVLRRHRQGRPARRGVPRAARLAPERAAGAERPSCRRPTTAPRSGATRPTTT